MTSLQIEQSCPQCGAPANLEETDRLFACPFCRVTSLLLTHDYFRYVLPARNPAGKDLVYVPYWRFKGMLLFSLPAGVEYKFIDVSHCATDAPAIPVTLGLRSQALKLKFVSPDMPGRFVRPARSFEETLAAFNRRFGQALPQPILHCAHLGESMSLMYSPFYTTDKLYDAVLDRPVAAAGGGCPDTGIAGGRPDWGVRFVAALCPACGWDLEGARNTLAMLCRNCRSVWYPAGETLRQVESACLEEPVDAGVYFPFWQITCDLSVIDLKSYADLARIANLPKIVDSTAGLKEFRFWTPAFKVRAQVFMRLAESLTLLQAQDRVAPMLPPGPHHPVTLPVAEACESLKVVLAAFFKPRQGLPELLPAITVRPTHHSLTYLPFIEDQHDFIQPQTRLAINKNLLSLSGNL
jgi:predicted RNA-binding Zn-ribbon protein involved in translation (DUF1610 family)